MTDKQIANHPYVDQPQALQEAWQEAIRDKKMRVRDAAEFLGVSEGALVATQVGSFATRLAPHLKGDWVTLIARIGALGRVMALTRNYAVVHERKGTYKDVTGNAHMGMALGDDIDLRLFLNQWQHAYAVAEPDGGAIKRSLQFFDAFGDAVHKVFLQPESSIDEFEMLCAQFAAPDQLAGENVYAKQTATNTLKPDNEIDVPAFHDAWAQLKDTHEFFGVLKKFGLARTQALRLAEPRFAYRVPVRAARAMLELAAQNKVAIMCFVANTGCIQIHTGQVENIQVMGSWLNVLDPDFNLHLREDHIAEAWIVKKPTTEGLVTSLELFDGDGMQLAQFFGKRKPGIPELQTWRDIIDILPRLTVPTDAMQGSQMEVVA